MNRSEIFTKKLSGNVTFRAFFDDKYKTEYLNIFMSLPLNRENATYASLVSRVLQRGSTSFPSMKSLSRALDENYAATLGAGAFKSGESEIFSVSLVGIKDRFALSGERVFERGVEILSDFMFNPLVVNDGFSEEYFEGERRNLIDSISAQINNKASYSRTRFIAAMCEGEAFATNGEGDIETAKGADPRRALEFYRRMLASSPCEIFYVGEKDPEQVLSLVEGLFKNRRVSEVKRTEAAFFARETKRVRESLDIAQGHLWIGFRTGITYSSPDYLSAVLFNMVLGGDVTGKMFMNLREKMSLCYTCHSSLDSLKGLLTAYAGIDPANAELTEKAFFEQLDKIKAGEISDSEIFDAKKSFANRMREILDNPSLFAMWYFIRLQAGVLRDPARDAEDIEKITREDIVRVAKKVELDTIYLLSGKENRA